MGPGMNFVLDIRPRASPDQRDLLGILLGASRGRGRDRTLQVWAKGLRCPLVPDLQSEVMAHSSELRLILISAFLGGASFQESELLFTGGYFVPYPVCVGHFMR